jgi:hypothetical protein
MPFLSCHFSYNHRPKRCAEFYFSLNGSKRKIVSAPWHTAPENDRVANEWED